MEQSNTFLLELLLEEMPAGIVADTAENLSTKVRGLLDENALAFSRIDPIATSRRFGCLVAGIALRGEGEERWVTGPAWSAVRDDEGNPTKAADGFARSKGVNVDQLQKVENEKGAYAGVLVRSKGVETAELLAKHLPAIFKSLRFPKEMRWGDGSGPFVRPLHGITAILNDKAVDFTFLGIRSGKKTFGHRLAGSDPIVLHQAGNYPELLKKALVVAFPAERKELFSAEIQSLAAMVNAVPPSDDPLLKEWLMMVEYPGVLLGHLDESVFSLPIEIVEEVLRVHQKAILLKDEAGKPLPHFLVVMDRSDDPKGEVQRGQEWVIRARFDDAAFFYKEDRAVPMVDRVERLGSITFHQDVGNFLQKTGRMQELTEFIAYKVGQEGVIPLALQAARLARADLTTHMVQEFPGLQGIVGGIYAREERVDERVATAIYQHYMPRFTGDEIPTGPVSAIVSLADRVDTLAALFAAGETPTGSRDPYGLRRAANGLILILLENGYNLDLDVLFTRAFQLLESSAHGTPNVLKELRAFISERFTSLMLERGFKEDEIRAVLEVRASHPVDAHARLKSLAAYRDRKEFLDFILAFKRVKNILKESVTGEIDPSLFAEETERRLYSDFIQAKEAFLLALNRGDYDTALKVMESLSTPLEAFFEDVMVLCEDEALRNNRLALLGHLYRQFLKIAQFSHLQVEKATYRN